MQPYVIKNYSTKTSPIFVDALGHVEGKVIWKFPKIQLSHCWEVLAKWGNYFMISGKDGFCTECVELDKSQSKTFNILKIPYTRSCGDDNRCVSDLELHSEFIGKL